MKALTVPAWAKINLTLDVLSLRSDGYHEMRMVMQSISLHDSIALQLTDTGSIRVHSSLRFLPSDDRNLAYKAASVYFAAIGEKTAGLDISLRKRIPVCAGLGGGSSDAAATLLGLNRLFGYPLPGAQLLELSHSIGSDVPFCLCGGTMLATGRGEILERLPDLPAVSIVVCKPHIANSTPELFQKIDARRQQTSPDTDGMIQALRDGDLSGVAHRVYNVFEEVLPRQRAGITAEIRRIMDDHGAMGSAMTGTGSAVFGLYADSAHAQTAVDALRHLYRDTYLTAPRGPCLQLDP